MMKMFRIYRRQFGMPDFIHVQVLYKSGVLAKYLKFRYGVRYVITEHYGIYNDKVADRFVNRSYLFRMFSVFGYTGANYSISVSEYLQRQMSIYFSSKSYFVIPNTVDTRLFFPDHSTSTSFVFIHVSEMTDNKNPFAIIRAFQKIKEQHPDVLLKIIGPLQNQPLLRESYELLTSRGIIFTGEVSYEQVSLNMRQSDCLILFSHMENSPCVIGEALCSGLQVIASDVGGVKELIDPYACQLVPAGDEEALQDAMLNALSNKLEIDRFEVAARAHARFSYEVIGGQFHQVYLKINTDTHI